MAELFPREPPTLSAQIAELRRELAVRGRVYPRFVAAGKLRQEAAEHHIACLQAAIRTLEDLQK